MHVNTPCTNRCYSRASENGNALFLIVVAIALFSGLFYAVMQSGRGTEASNISNQSDLILSSQIMQYPASIRAGITRMLIRGVDASALKFNPPERYGDNIRDEVFHPDGGGVVYKKTPDDAVLSTTPDRDSPNGWTFHKNITVENIATDAPEIVALLTSVKTDICETINQTVMGAPDIPIMADITRADMVMGNVNLDANQHDKLPGQLYMCVQTFDGDNVYYHVLMEL